jgi:hypothetical protein
MDVSKGVGLDVAELPHLARTGQVYQCALGCPELGVVVPCSHVIGDRLLGSGLSRQPGTATIYATTELKQFYDVSVPVIHMLQRISADRNTTVLWGIMVLMN